ncbi:hypothetical protein H9W84_11775 [Moraxella sp. PS-22]|uniref:Uncharacterized protein n=1 Tax=Moraxella tetraodonis TaxID=2767221 RepID=A0A9X1UTY4_9GAMM|nr:hypothetical protein [Moraxella tetraodonis]MCG8148781.1 hypothetical protein [Moraxella tetraodonis]
MSSNQTNKSKAELHFYEAFVRLKENKPKNLPRGTKVSQNNVAKEAGVDPSALRKTRYPELINEIQQWIDDNPQTGKKADNKKSKTNSEQILALKKRIEELTIQRDQATSKLLEAQIKLIEMANEIKRLSE